MANFKVNREENRLKIEFEKYTPLGEILQFLQCEPLADIPQVEGKCLTACYRYLKRDDCGDRCTASPVFQDDSLDTNGIPKITSSKQCVHLIISDPRTSSIVLRLGTDFSTPFIAYDNTLSVDLSKVDRLVSMLTAIGKIRIERACA